MTIRKKISLFSALALGAFLAAVYLVAQFALMEAFARLEGEFAQNTVHQIRSALDHKQSNLDTLAQYYSQSGAASELLQGRASESQATAFAPEALKNLDIAFVGMVDGVNNLTFFKSAGNWSPDASELQTITIASSLGSKTQALGRPRGILQVGSHLLLLSSRPLVFPSADGPSRGNFVLAREVDDAEVATLSTSIGVPVWLEPATNLAGVRQGIVWSDGIDSARI